MSDNAYSGYDAKADENEGKRGQKPRTFARFEITAHGVTERKE